MQLLKMITIVQSYMILHYGYNIFSSSDFGVRSENGSIEKKQDYLVVLPQ